MRDTSYVNCQVCYKKASIYVQDTQLENCLFEPWSFLYS